MLLGHSTNSHVSSDYDHCIVWEQAYQTEHGGLQVLLMAAEIQEGQQFLGVSGNVRP